MIPKGILIACLAALALITVYGGEQEKPNSFSETREMVLLRKIGHDLLLTGGDSSTRILPLKKITENEYRLFFEMEQSISPDSFLLVLNETARRYDLPGNFTASIHRCLNDEIVYATLFSKDEAVTTCGGRNLPKDCYYLQFVFAPAKNNTGRMILLSAIGLIVLVTSAYLYYQFGPRRKKPDVQVQDATAMTGPEFISIGATQFYPGQQYLLINGIKNTLTPRETKLLGLLAASPDLVVDRDTLQTEIWEKEGVIVTRSLDMFVSKLRKKLQPDPSLRISVIHGKGYKLETGVQNT